MDTGDLVTGFVIAGGVVIWVGLIMAAIKNDRDIRPRWWRGD